MVTHHITPATLVDIEVGATRAGFVPAHALGPFWTSAEKTESVAVLLSGEPVGGAHALERLINQLADDVGFDRAVTIALGGQP